MLGTGIAGVGGERGFGNLAIPRVGGEVVWTSSTRPGPAHHHGTHLPPGQPPTGQSAGTKTQMTIRSKTYKGGGFNELTFDDATGKGRCISMRRRTWIRRCCDRTTTVNNNHTETVVVGANSEDYGQ